MENFLYIPLNPPSSKGVPSGKRGSLREVFLLENKKFMSTYG